MYVLDGLNDAVPVGVPGELHVSGACLAHGYLEFPALTAERFVPNPYFDLYTDDAQYSRMFRTGDLAVRLNDGSLVYLGPMDQQARPLYNKFLKIGNMPCLHAFSRH